MASAGKKPLKYRRIQEHGPIAQKRWKEMVSAVQQIQLPVMFYHSDSSQVILVNEDIDKAASRAFSPVTEWMGAVENGDRFVRAITQNDVECFLSALNDNSAPLTPDESVTTVEEYANRILDVLRTLTEVIPPSDLG